MMLKDLTSVIAGLETLCLRLQQEAPQDSARPEEENSRSLLLAQWQKLFNGQLSPSVPASSHKGLSAMAAQLLKKLRRYQQQQQQQQQQQRQQLLQAARHLHNTTGACEQLSPLLQGLASGEQQALCYLQPLLACYQQAVVLCAEQQTQGQHNQRELCQHLLQLIDEMDFSGATGAEIEQIQQQLLTQTDTTALPDLCLQLIELVIEGSRSERQYSTRFLARLNEELEGMQGQCASSVSEGRALVNDRQVHDADLAGELNAIGAHLAGQDQPRLTREIELRMSSIRGILSRHEQLQQREASLLTQLQSLENQVTRLQKEASDYRQRLTRQNEKLLIDNLTQLYNRTALNERMKAELERWQVKPQPLAVILLDVDHFKKVNDRYGHLAGDKALRLIARTLRKNLKESDFVARFGGEEFVLLMLNVDPALLHRPLEQLGRKIEAIPFRFKQERVTITVSMGATLLTQGDTISSALERADQALYRAKNAGRNQLIIA